MQVEQQNMDNTVVVNANKIIAKYRNKQDRLLFCHEKNWWHPSESGFDSTFFLQVIAGKKKYLPGNFTVKHKLGYFRKGIRLDKKYIIGKMQGNALYRDYVPDKCDPIKLSKEFLLTLVAYVDPQLYKDFYNSYKEELMKKNYNKWSDYNINISKNLINDVNSFIPMSQKNKKQGGFKTFKNHQGTNVFTQINNIGMNNNRRNQKQEIIGTQMNQINNLQQLNSQNMNRINELEQQIILKNEENQKLNILLNNKSIKSNSGVSDGISQNVQRISPGKYLNIQISKKNKL